MPEPRISDPRARPTIGVVVAALLFSGLAAGQTPPTLTTQPAESRPTQPETIAAARERLVPPRRPPAARPRARARGKKSVPAPVQEQTSERPSRLPEQDLVLLAALDLTLALGRADGARAAELIDAVGYQPLPLAGELPQEPARLIPRQEIRSRVTARGPTRLDRLPVASFEVHSREAVRALFPAVADWMLPTDWAVVIRPVPDAAEWVTEPCCLVVRLRARKATILGGSLLAVLP